MSALTDLFLASVLTNDRRRVRKIAVVAALLIAVYAVIFCINNF